MATCLQYQAIGCILISGARNGFDRTKPKPVSLNWHAPDLTFKALARKAG